MAKKDNEMAMLSIYNRLARIVVIHLATSVDIKTNDGVRTEVGYESFPFKPGENFILEKDYFRLKEVEMFKTMVATGQFDAPDNLGGVYEIGEINDKNYQANLLNQIPVNKLIAKIKGDGFQNKGVLDIELLTRLKLITKSQLVIKTIDEQLEGTLQMESV